MVQIIRVDSYRYIATNSKYYFKPHNYIQMIIKCFALWQPWAQMVIEGFKEWETRPGYNSHRGITGILATKKCGNEEGFCESLFYSETFYPYLQARGFQKFSDLPRGGVLGTVECKSWLQVVTGPVHDPRFQMLKPGGDQQYFGDFRPGRYGIRLSNANKFDSIFHANGQQNMLFNIDVPDHIINKNLIQF
jgi:hypothetical protein